jgi:hypothetical protein
VSGVDLKATDALNLGEVLRGARIYETPYDFKMQNNQQCKILCRSQYDKEEIEAFSLMTEEEYRVNLLLDNLPGMYAASQHTQACDIVLATAFQRPPSTILSVDLTGLPPPPVPAPPSHFLSHKRRAPHCAWICRSRHAALHRVG